LPVLPAGIATSCSARYRSKIVAEHAEGETDGRRRQEARSPHDPVRDYVLTADDGKGNVGAATVNWVTQGSFAPPLVVVGVKADSGAHTVVKGTGRFERNMLGKDQKGLGFTFFNPAKVEDGKVSGQAFHSGTNGSPILDAAIAAVECSVKQIVELGDHHIVVAEVTEAYVMKPPGGRADAAILQMKDLGDTVYYGGRAILAPRTHSFRSRSRCMRSVPASRPLPEAAVRWHQASPLSPTDFFAPQAGRRGFDDSATCHDQPSPALDPAATHW
jgi:flavin reductase (DIM6/NTAB) family NADH-FMN oxidoreductase RutF